MTETQNISGRPVERSMGDETSASESAKLVLDQLPWLIRQLREKQMSQPPKPERPTTTDAK